MSIFNLLFKTIYKNNFKESTLICIFSNCDICNASTVEGVETEWAPRGVAFARHLPDRMPPASLDPVRVRTAARILCRHAAVAAEEVGGGEVQVSVRELPSGWELAVADPGRTLPADLRQTAFVPFTPQRARGSGLGLAVVARIAQEHRGEAQIEERNGGGNLIRVSFGA